MSWKRWLAGTFLVLALTLLGAVSGGLLYRIIPHSAIGWDALGDVLGYLMVGTVLGLIVGIILALRLSAKALSLGVAATGVALLVLFALARVLPENRRSGPGSLPQFKPEFEVQLFTRIGAQRADQLTERDAGFRYRELRVASSSRSLTSKSWGPLPQTYCSAPLDQGDLETLSRVAEGLASASLENCEGSEGSEGSEGLSGYTLNLRFDGQPTKVVQVTSQCLGAHEPWTDFLAAWDSIRARHGWIPGCASEPSSTATP